MRLTLLGLVLFTLPAVAGQVHVVGPGHLATIQDAITLASDGDVILVKSGAYATVRIADKSVAVVADTGATVTIDGAIRVTNTAATRPVVLSGLRVTGVLAPTLPELGNALHAVNCAGPIVAQDCTLLGAVSAPSVCNPAEPSHALELQTCNSVAITRCMITGGHGDSSYPSISPTQPTINGDGLRAHNGTRVSIDSSVINGGSGGFSCNGFGDGTSGGTAVRLVTSSLYVCGSSVNGGPGSDGQPGAWSSALGGDGATPVALDYSLIPQVVTLASTFLAGWGGNGGCGFFPSGCHGANGAPFNNPAWSGVLSLAGSAKRLTGPALVRDNETPEFRVDAAPGDRVEIAVARAPTYQTDVASGCILHVKDPNWIVAGVVPPGGNNVKRRYHMPDLSVTTPGQIFYVQARVTSATGVQRLTNVQAVVLVDSSY